MQGLLTFASLKDAIAQGFTLYDRTNDGYLVRKRINNQWALAIVKP